MFKKIFSVFILTIGLLTWTAITRGSNGKECLKLLGEEKNTCVTNIVDKYLDRHQVSEALAFLNNYQELDKDFYATDCHGIVHYIGDKAYKFYKEGLRLDFG